MTEIGHVWDSPLTCSNEQTARNVQVTRPKESMSFYLLVVCDCAVVDQGGNCFGCGMRSTIVQQLYRSTHKVLLCNLPPAGCISRQYPQQVNGPILHKQAALRDVAACHALPICGACEDASCCLDARYTVSV